MKKALMLIFVFMLLNAKAFSQIYSNGTGGGAWNTGSTWLGGVAPSASSDVIIVGTDSVYFTGTGACTNLTVQSGGKLSTAVDSVSCSGTFTLEANAWFYNNTTKGSVPGSIRALDPASTVVHSGAGTVGGTNNTEFGNLIIKRTAGLTCAANLIINGNLTIRNSVGQVLRGSNLTYRNTVQTVHGNVYLESGVLSAIDVGDATMVTSWDIDGDVIVSDTGRIGPFSSASAAGTGIFNIKGSLIINGGRIQAGTSSTAGSGTGIINIGKNFTITTPSTVATNHAGPFAINFNGTGTQTVKLGRSFSMSTVVNDTIKTGSTVVYDLDTAYWRSTVGGDFVVNGSLELKGVSTIKGLANFTLSPNSTLKIGSPAGVNTDTLGNIIVTGVRTFSPEANYEYKGTTVQSLGNALPSPLAGFNVNNPTGIILDRNLTVNKTMKILSGDLDLNGFTVTMGSDAVLTETAGNTVKGTTGKLTVNKTLNAPSSVNAGGLGAVITSAVNLGSTTIERYHSPRKGSGNQSIARYYSIVPANNTNLNAKLRLYYDESELNGNPEANLVIQKSATGADNTWGYKLGGVNTIQNYVEADAVTDFAFFTMVDLQHLLPVENESKDLPTVYSLGQNFPNPFNPSTRISYTLPETSHLTLKIYDILGKEIAVLINEVQAPGKYEVNFNLQNVIKNNSSGVYFYTLKAGQFTETKKMVLLK